MITVVTPRRARDVPQRAASVARDGRRKWIYARQPSGPLYRARTLVSSFLLAFLFWRRSSTVGGQPLMLLNMLERRFVLFGVALPSPGLLPRRAVRPDRWSRWRSSPWFLGGSGAAGSARRRCSWRCCSASSSTCIEGSAEQQLRRDRGPWTSERVVRDGTEARRLLRPLLRHRQRVPGLDHRRHELAAIVSDPPGRHLAGLTAIVVFSFVFYLVFARFREQACVLACPYGRVMSSLSTPAPSPSPTTRLRGEPRSRRCVRRRAAPPATASTATSASPCARPASTSATAFSSSASTARRASTRATPSWSGSAGRPA